MVQSHVLDLFYRGNCNTDKARLALVSISLESAILGYDIETYGKVVRLLKEKYGCTLYDCYEHPEYLRAILGMLPKNSRYGIVKSVRRTLGDFSRIKSIATFLDVLST